MSSFPLNRPSRQSPDETIPMSFMMVRHEACIRGIDMAETKKQWRLMKLDASISQVWYRDREVFSTLFLYISHRDLYIYLPEREIPVELC